MKIIVIGYGRVGSQFIRKVDTAAHQVVVVDPVDRDEDEAQQVCEEPALLVHDVGEVVPRRRVQLEDGSRVTSGATEVVFHREPR